MPVKDKQSGHAPDTIPSGDLAAYLAEHTQAHHTRSTFQISLDPIHDGFCQEASASGIAVHLYQDRLSSSDE
jgi:hypothetical protein